MSTTNKARGWSLKSIYFSIRDALAYRMSDRDPNNRDITHEPVGGNTNSTPHIDRALQLSTVWSCVRLISGTISTLPLFLYERTTTDGQDTRRPAREHPLYDLLHRSPNADMTAVEFWESVVASLLTWGNAYVLKTRGYANRLVSLDPLDPARMRLPYKDKAGRTRFDYSTPGGLKEYTENDVWHIKGFGTNGLVGVSPVGMGWRSMLGAANIAQAGSNMFGGSMRPSGVVSIPDILGPDQRKQMQEVITNGIFGNSEMGRTYMLEGGAKYEQLTINPIDAQMIEQMNASVEDLCRWFQVPPSMIGHGTAVSNWGTGREQINLGFKQYVLDPITTRIEQSIEKHLLTAAERLKYYAEHSFEGMLRADSAGRAAFYATMVQNGIYTRRFCRSLENQPPMEGDNELTVQSNLIPVKMLGKITATTQPAPEKTE